MAKMLEQTLTIKFTTLVQNSSSTSVVLSAEQLELISQSIPELIESIINSSNIIIEIDNN